ncbi:MAG: hypothetical protein JW932_10705 [Deltaproteobacteria bacterium]|nr:hypothetical protein [Deltaproteobacteria bacterium]
MQDDGGTANGGDDTSPQATFSIAVGDVNDEPTFTSGGDVTVLEDSGATTFVAWATNISPGPADEAGQTLTFNIVNNTNAALFSAGPAIDGTTGDLTFTPAADANGIAAITITLQDDGGTAGGGDDTSPLVFFNITVTPVNDEPSFTTGSNVTVLEDSGATTFAAWATGMSAGPADEAGQALSFNIAGNTNPGLFAAGPAVDGTTGDLTFTPALNANGSATITIELQDNGSTANGGDDTSSQDSFTITVTAVNDEPSFTAGSNVTVLEDSGANTFLSWATNMSPGPADETGQALTFNIAGNSNPGLFAAGPAINATTGNLAFTPAADANGSATITIELQDSGGIANGGDDTSPQVSFTITVTPVNDVPSFTPGGDISVLENVGAYSIEWATNISVGPANESSQTPSFMVSNDNNGMFSAQPAISVSGTTGTLTFTPADISTIQTATVTVELKDDGGVANGGVDTSPAVTFQIKIAPVWTLTINWDGAGSNHLIEANPVSLQADPVSPFNPAGYSQYGTSGDSLVILCEHDDQIQLVATPDFNYSVTWSGDYTGDIHDAEQDLIMDSDKTLTATFDFFACWAYAGHTVATVTDNSVTNAEINPAGEWDYYEVNVAISGQITIYSAGSTDTYGYLLDSDCQLITENDDKDGSDTNFQIKQELTAGTHYIAVRHYDQTSGTGYYDLHIECCGHTIIASAGGGGSISPLGTSIVSNGASKSFTITAYTNNVIAEILVDGVAQSFTAGSTSFTYVFTNVTQDHTISATFLYPAGLCVDISDIPLETQFRAAPPMIMFVLDDSGSMDFSTSTDQYEGLFIYSGSYYAHIFDDPSTYNVNWNQGGWGEYILGRGGARLKWKSQWSGYNKMYYNPDAVYTPWPRIVSVSGNRTNADADPDNPRYQPMVAGQTIDLDGSYDTVSTGVGGTKITDNSDASFSMTPTLAEVIIDNDHPTQYKDTGPNWDNDDSGDAYNGDYNRTLSTGIHTAEWTPNLVAGTYNVYAWWRASSRHATNVPYTIHYSGLSTTVTVNQETLGAQWNLLGTYTFNGDPSEKVDITYNVTNSTYGRVCADAVRFEPVGAWGSATSAQAYNNGYLWTSYAGNYTATWTPNLTTAAQYEVFARWVAASSRSSAVSYTITHATGSDTVSMDQTATGGSWVSLGTYNFNGVATENVTLSATVTNPSSDSVCADAVQFVRAGIPSTIDIKRAHYYVWSATNNAPYLIVLDGTGTVGQILYYKLTDSDGDEFIDTGELLPDTSPPADVITGRTYDAERQNFANWFSFYRKRYLTAIAAVGQTIEQAEGVEIGFKSINNSLTKPLVSSSQKDTLLTNLYTYFRPQTGGTPLRMGLKVAGQYYDDDDGVNPTGLGASPYATAANNGECQQAFTILMTDGYWNGTTSPNVGGADNNNGVPYADSTDNTLADVAMYYYERDLSDETNTTGGGSLDLADNVPTNQWDSADWQHMVTFGVSFGLSGSLNPDDYDEDLKHETTGAYISWPPPVSGTNTTVDDLWHASENGRGQFLSASDPTELLNSLLAIITNISLRQGSASSVSINGDELYGTLGDAVRMYQSSYQSDGWIGDVKCYDIDSNPSSPTYGEVNTTPDWKASDYMPLWTSRKIATYNGSSGIPFRMTNLTTSQKADLANAFETSGVTETVNFLRGDQSNEEPTGSFRTRSSILGDIIHSSPVHRKGALYAGGNDGMLHTFDATNNGEELFAYVPNLIFQNLKNLVDPNYSHTYYVDLTPVISDTTISGVTTMLVGGLGKGGKGYYALNISGVSGGQTITESEVANNVMWEFPDNTTASGVTPYIGYSYSTPVIVESNDASNPWVVIFGNGYNSPNSTAVLFILNAETGALVRMIDTGAAVCNGLSSPAAIDVPVGSRTFDYKVDYVFAGDLRGNMWKFDLTSSNPADWAVAYGDDTNSDTITDTPQPIFQARGPAGAIQPITTRPDVMFHCEYDGFMVLFATGSYLGNSDFTDNSTQTIYGIWDFGDDADDTEYLGYFDRSANLTLSNNSKLQLLQQTYVPSGVTVADPNAPYFWTVIDPVSGTTELYRILTDNTPYWEVIDDANGVGTQSDPGSRCWDGVDQDGASGPDNVEECVGGGYRTDGVDNDSDSKIDELDEAKIDAGWFFDLPLTGERVVVDPMIRGGVLIAISFSPQQASCGSGGSSVVMAMDSCSGGRLNQAFYDINDDGVFDQNDLIEIAPGVFVPPTGIFYDGMMRPPAFSRLTGSDMEMGYYSVDDEISTQRQRKARIGMSYWMEISD